jgi:hypothetical protein
MLDALNTTLDRFFREEIPLRASEVDISFDTPDGEWGARQTRPTVNVFLHEVRRSTVRAATGSSTTGGPGAYQRTRLAPFVRVRYAVSVWASEAADQHRLLGQLLGLVVTTGIVPRHLLSSPLDQLGSPVELAIASEDVRPAHELWSALGVSPRATLELVATLPAAPVRAIDLADPPTEVLAGVADRDVPSRRTGVTRQGSDPAQRVGGVRRGTAVLHEG